MAKNYTYPSPLAGLESLAESNRQSSIDPKSQKLSKAYERFESPIRNGSKNGFDFHIYYHPDDEFETKYIKELYERVQREFPEISTYRLWDRAIGPHPLPFFEVDCFSPQQVGALFSFLVIHRGPLSVLVHPNTDDVIRDHTQRATWMGEKQEIKVKVLEEFLSQGH